MGVIKFGGGTGDFIFRVVDGVPRAVPYAAITPYPDVSFEEAGASDAVGGEPYTSVTDATGDDSTWPGGTGRALSDGAIPLAHLDYGIAQQRRGCGLIDLTCRAGCGSPLTRAAAPPMAATAASTWS